MLDGIAFRRAVLGDAAALANVHVASWRETYARLLPARVIDARTPEARTQSWERALRACTRGTVVAERAGVICAFAHVRATPTEPFDAYLQSLYCLRATQRIGIGRELLRCVATAMVAQKMRSLRFEVLASNPARAFYERMGARFEDDRIVVDADASWLQCSYVWTDVAAILSL